MITPPLLIFYVCFLVIMIFLSKILFNVKYSDDELIITGVALIYIIFYLAVYIMINFPAGG